MIDQLETVKEAAQDIQKFVKPLREIEIREFADERVAYLPGAKAYLRHACKNMRLCNENPVIARMISR